jgi:hypothetical protein
VNAWPFVSGLSVSVRGHVAATVAITDSATLTVLGCTISPMGGNTSLPGFDTPQHESARQALNQWIRTSRAFDGAADADQVLRDPAVADSIDLNLLR